MPPKVAVVVFVKNEYPDFCTWLAWYFAIGVDTVIVYDDHSTDGTWEAALAAARCFDVRPLRTDLSVEPFTARQRETYLGAIRAFRDQFDWIGFLDADEYLYLRTGPDLPTFLESFPDAAAMAFSWCIYGSNGHLLKPSLPTVEAFTRHSSPEFGHNRSVKSFVRPHLVVDRWRDPHTFDVGGRPYLDPKGQPVRWGGPGAISHPPDWSVAKLMHFIPRSMEHFVERIRRRSDLQGLTNEYWNVFNINELEDREPLRLLPELYRNLFRINTEIRREFCEAVRNGSTQSDPTHTSSGHVSPPVIAWQAKTHFGTTMGIDRDGQLVHALPETLSMAGCKPVFLVALAEQSVALYLLAPDSTDPVRIKNDYRIADVLGFVRIAEAEGRPTTLRVPCKQRYLTALPPDSSGIGTTSGDRWDPKEWEHFVLTPISSLPQSMSHCLGLGSLPATSPSLEEVCRIIELGGATQACSAAMQFLSRDQRASIPTRLPAALPAWL